MWWTQDYSFNWLLVWPLVAMKFWWKIFSLMFWINSSSITFFFPHCQNPSNLEAITPWLRIFRYHCDSVKPTTVTFMKSRETQLGVFINHLLVLLHHYHQCLDSVKDPVLFYSLHWIHESLSTVNFSNQHIFMHMLKYNWEYSFYGSVLNLLHFEFWILPFLVLFYIYRSSALRCQVFLFPFPPYVCFAPHLWVVSNHHQSIPVPSNLAFWFVLSIWPYFA